MADTLKVNIQEKKEFTTLPKGKATANAPSTTNCILVNSSQENSKADNNEQTTNIDTFENNSTPAAVDTDTEDFSSGKKALIKTKKYISYIALDKRKLIQKIASETGLSADYIRMLVNEESFTHCPCNNDITDDSRSNGTLTVGFGHTTPLSGKYFVGSNYKPDEVYEITEENKGDIYLSFEEACEILQEDLTKCKADVIEYFGAENFNKAPQSIQDAITDIRFKKGLEAFNPENSIDSPTTLLKNDLENENYTAAAQHVIYKTNDLNAKQRNIVRFIHSVKNLEPEQRKIAKNNTEECYTEVLREYQKQAFALGISFTKYVRSIKAKLTIDELRSQWGSIDTNEGFHIKISPINTYNNGKKIKK